MNLTLSQMTKFVDGVKPLPWRTIAILMTVSFLLASSVSTVIGYLMMSQTERSYSSGEVSETNTTWSKGPTLNKTQLDKILERNLFNSEGQIGDVDPNAKSGDKAAKTSLPIKVVGIIYGGDPYTGLAMVENTEKHTVNSFLVGDPLAPDANIKEVRVDQILIDNQGRQEFAMLEDTEIRRSSRKGKKQPTNASSTTSLTGSGFTTEAPPDNYKEDGFERKGNAIEMTQEYKNRLLSVDFANVLQDAKASPNLVDGTLRGWRMERIRKGSIYEKAGVQNGDVIEEINGVMLSDAGQSIKLLQSLRNESEIDIRLNRNGKTMNVIFKVR